MKKYDDTVYMKHILENIDLIPVHLSYLKGEAWHENPTIRHAILYTLHTLAESCKKISAKTQSAVSEVNWKKIAGFRNVLVYEYLGSIDYDIVSAAIA